MFDDQLTDTSKKTILTALLILLISSAGYISIDLYLPSLPAIAKHYLIGANLAQLTVTAFLASFCLSQLIYGYIRLLWTKISLDYWYRYIFNWYIFLLFCRFDFYFINTVKSRCFF